MVNLKTLKIMRKTVIAVLALAAAMFVSCNKETPVEGNKEIKFDFSVADLPGDAADTRAVKTGWASGDKINIWIDDNVQAEPDLVLTYDGSKWNAGTLREGVEFRTDVTPERILRAMYEGYNDLKKYQADNWTSYYVFNSSTTTESGEKANFINLTAYINRVLYQFDGETVKFVLGVDGNGWRFLTDIQVVVSGLPEGKNYWLRGNAENFTTNKGGIKMTVSGFTNDGDDWEYYAKGQDNADGQAFYFYKRANSSGTGDLEFTLLDSDGGMYTYNAGPKSTSPSPDKLQAVKIPFSKFTKVTE